MKSVVTACALAIVAFANAQSTATTDKSIVDIKLGGSQDYVGSKSVGYYNVAVFGHTLGSSGSEVKFGDYAAGGLADVTQRPYFLSLQRGLLNVGGSQLKAYNVNPIKQFVPALRDWNIVLGVDAQVDALQNTTYTAGLEYRPLFPLSGITEKYEGGAPIPVLSNFLVFGASGQRSVANNGQATGQYQLTARAWVGRSFYIGHAAKDAHQNRIKSLLKENRSDYDTVAKVMKAFKDLANINDADLKDLVMYLHARIDTTHVYENRVPTQSEWDTVLNDTVVLGSGKPNLVVWADGNGRYAFSSSHVGGAFRDIYSLNFKFLLDSSNKLDKYVQVQFVNGFTELNPGKRVNSLVWLAGVSF